MNEGRGEHADHYYAWPCENVWHRSSPDVMGRKGACPDCTNTWWAVDGTECPDEYAMMARVDELALFFIHVETETEPPVQAPGAALMAARRAAKMALRRQP